MAAVKRGQTGSRAINAALAKLASGEDTRLATYTVAGLPAASGKAGRLVRVSNGNAGQPCLAVSDGTNWKVIALGANVAAA
ncbi:hypothetical protein ACLBXM_20135 [Xanthobacteraceae bacterium A53D]